MSGGDEGLSPASHDVADLIQRRVREGHPRFPESSTRPRPCTRAESSSRNSARSRVVLSTRPTDDETILHPPRLPSVPAFRSFFSLAGRRLRGGAERLEGVQRRHEQNARGEEGHGVRQDTLERIDFCSCHDDRQTT